MRATPRDSSPGHGATSRYRFRTHARVAGKLAVFRFRGEDMAFPRVALCALACASLSAFADGPADRRPTDPHTVTSAKQAGSAALPVEALLTTNHTYGFAHSNDGRKLAYISDASGRDRKSTRLNSSHPSISY